jgi:hypothetical protein
LFGFCENLLSLVTSWLDNICQIKTKSVTVTFHRLNPPTAYFFSVGCGRLSNFTSTAHLSPDYGLDRAPREFTASLPTLRTNLFVCLCKLSDMSSYLLILLPFMHGANHFIFLVGFDQVCSLKRLSRS